MSTGFLCGVMRTFWNETVVMPAVCTYTKTTDLDTLKFKGVNRMVKYISIKLVNQRKPLKPSPCPAGDSRAPRRRGACEDRV